MSDAKEKLKALQLTLDKLEKTYGKGTVMKLSDEKVIDVPAISTGSLGLDLALGVGGIPRGRITEIYGPESSGKTTLTLHCIAEAQKKGGIAAEKMILWVFSGVAAIMLVIAIFSSFGVISKISKEESANGRVMDMIVKVQYMTDEEGRQLPSENFYYPVVEFRSSDGRRHYVQLVEGSSPASFEIGEDVTILYDPEHPLDARIKSVGSSLLLWVLPGITGILGLSFLVAVLVVHRFLI